MNRLELVVEEALSNAVYHGALRGKPPRTVPSDLESPSIPFPTEPSPYVSVHLRIDSDSLRLTVADDGPGYPDNMLAKPASLVEEAEVGKGGTHLGIYFADRIASFHQQNNRSGYIKLENGDPLGGGVFKLYIP